MNEFAARRAQAWIRGPREQDHDRVSAGGSNMRGTGIVAHGQGRGPRQSGEPGNIGPTDEVQRLGANVADRASEICFAMDAHQDG